MASQSAGRRGMLWAVIGGLVLVAGIIAIIVASVLSQSAPTPSPSDSSSQGPNDPSPTASAPQGDEFVDPAAADRGWRPEPITTDAEPYIRAALESASTFDTQKSTREEWLDYLDTWFTPDTRYTAEADQQAADEGLAGGASARSRASAGRVGLARERGRPRRGDGDWRRRVRTGY